MSMLHLVCDLCFFIKIGHKYFTLSSYFVLYHENLQCMCNNLIVFVLQSSKKTWCDLHEHKIIYRRVPSSVAVNYQEWCWHMGERLCI